MEISVASPTIKLIVFGRLGQPRLTCFGTSIHIFTSQQQLLDTKKCILNSQHTTSQFWLCIALRMLLRLYQLLYLLQVVLFTTSSFTNHRSLLLLVILESTSAPFYSVTSSTLSVKFIQYNIFLYQAGVDSEDNDPDSNFQLIDYGVWYICTIYKYHSLIHKRNHHPTLYHHLIRCC